MNFYKRLSLAAVLVSATALTPLIAQTDSDIGTPAANLDIPEGQQLFGKNDPNVRREIGRAHV